MPDTPETISRGASRTWPAIAGLLWVATAILFFTFSRAHGGAALHGKIVGGHYFVGSHSSHPEVSRGVFFLSAASSAACGLMLSVFTVVMIWHQLRQSKRLHLLTWFGSALALTIGFAVFGLSVRCVMGTN